MFKKDVCRKQQDNLEIAFEIACDHGLVDHHIPHRTYDYSEYFSSEDLVQLNAIEGINLGTEIKQLHSVEKASILLGVVLGSNRKNVNDIYNNLQENDIVH